MVLKKSLSLYPLRRFMRRNPGAKKKKKYKSPTTRIWKITFIKIYYSFKDKQQARSLNTRNIFIGFNRFFGDFFHGKIISNSFPSSFTKVITPDIIIKNFS